MLRNLNSVEAYQAGWAAYCHATKQYGRLFVGPCQADADDWGHEWDSFSRGWVAAFVACN